MRSVSSKTSTMDLREAVCIIILVIILCQIPCSATLSTNRSYDAMITNQIENTTANADTNNDMDIFDDASTDEIIRKKRAIAKGIEKVVPPCILVVGTLGNTLSGAVMIQKTYRRTVTGLLFFVLAIVDTLVLYIGLIR